MVRKRRSWPNSETDADSQQTLQETDSDSRFYGDSVERHRRSIGFWRCIAVLAIAAFAILLVLHAVTVMDKNRQLADTTNDFFPCPPKDGGLLTSGDPKSPGPFHDITVEEYNRLYRYLMGLKELNLAPPDRAAVNTSNIFMVDLLLPPKQDVLNYLDKSGDQPAREARVVIFRGEKSVVEEYRVGPLNKPSYCRLIENTAQRPGSNPVPFSVRPVGKIEFAAITEHLMPKVDKEIGFILEESYGGKFTDCDDNCLAFYPTPVGTELLGYFQRQIWFWGLYPAEYYSLHPVDFGVLLSVEGSNPDYWSVGKVWYAGTIYKSMEDLARRYGDTSNPIKKTRVSFTRTDPNDHSSIHVRGPSSDGPPKRPPVQVEPDGKRYSITHRNVKYLHWDFNTRLSGFTGPQLYDVRFQGERIAYELGLSEIAVYYSGDSPVQRVTDFVDSGALIGTHSKSLIPGADCPEGATFLNVSFLGEAMEKPTTLQRAICVFEHNYGVPLRRHLSYSRDQGAFYGGMEDSALTVRSILTIVNYDYIVDFVFHQTGALEVRVISTGYILSTFYRPEEAPYGFRLDEHINGNIHHHMFHFKADLDILGTANRYETLDITTEEVNLKQIGPKAKYRQTRLDRNLRKREMEAVYDFNFDHPKYHIVHNQRYTTKYGVPRAFRLHLEGMSKQMLPPDVDNERSLPWARHQLAVTVQKDDERVSSSPYAMFDSLDPVVNFTSFFSDDQNVVDKDLVYWIALGTHHIPHTEDLPNTPTVDGHLAFFLLPYNYFPECPSVSSRDNIRVDYVKPFEASEGLRVERNGNKVSGACGVLTLEQLVRERPDDIIQTNNDFKLY
ncbi:hypothetical protein BaRGS_00011889 [Batillaria attramentaria]|uniref:Amine oxidase n=1 Tax=Batillaria attramentaria TaxID=370345 RepID=A0ABD0LBV4_9CAEN